MFYSSAARQQITEDCEGVKLTAYPDPATGGEPWTIGYGHTGGVHEGDTCSMAQAIAWLEDDLAMSEDEVNDFVTVPLTQDQFDALVDFDFNCGGRNLRNSTLLRRLNAKDYAGADAEFKKWVYGGGHILPGLVKRREMEANWFNRGKV